ncbi:MAG: tyrosine-type recombinase/integrase, partial [Oribacterium parvum]|nr:tyrosine-type recombinase/integrase [Oribacterium parvum]
KKTGKEGQIEEVEVLNHNKSIKRKISSLKSFFGYLYKTEQIKENKTALLSLPKLSQEEIVRMDQGEVAQFLDQVESGEDLSKKEKHYHEKNQVRDLAMMQLMLGTGIRVSECVGLNCSDVDFQNNAIRIHRKGGKEVSIYFSDEVEQGLRAYMEERKSKIPAAGHENALFLSLQNKRMSVRTVELMVKKYAQKVTPLKHITPHKLRSSYGTNLYQETGDIYLVADVLGHSDVNTTKKHYAALEEERRRSVRNLVRLRKEEGE